MNADVLLVILINKAMSFVPVNKVDSEGNTPLLIASRDGDVSRLETLIQCGSEVNCLNKYHQRAVDEVWERVNDDVKYYECMYMLLEAGSVFPQNFDADYILQSNDPPHKLKTFVKKRVYLHECIKRWEIEKIQELASIQDVTSLLGVTNDWPIHTAAEFGNEDVLAFLLKLLSPVSPGELNLSENEVKLLKQENGRCDTALHSAARAGKKGNVGLLLRCGADVNFANAEGKRVIDLAWEGQHYDVCVALLDGDAHFPDRFGSEQVTVIDERAEELKAFVENRNKLHEAVKSGDLATVKKLIEVENSFSKYYLNCENRSVLHTAISSQEFNNYAFLKSKGICFKDKQEETIMYNLAFEDKIRLKESLLQYFPKVKGSHLQYLVSKSKTTQPYENFQKRAYDIFNKLDNIEGISTVLKVIQYSDYLEIIFDLGESDISHANPVHHELTKGTVDFYEGRIYVSFKVDSAEEELERLGTLAHELTHFAMQVVYQNKCNPYRLEDKERQAEFEEIIKTLREKCQKSEDTDINLKRVFRYSDDEQAAELIVRVPHILAIHGEKQGNAILELQAGKLLSYFNRYVMEDCKSLVEENYLIKSRNVLRLLNQYLGQLTAIENTDIEFEYAKDLSEFVDSSSKYIMIIKTESTWLSTISVYQALQELLHSSAKSSVLFLRLVDFENCRDDIINTFKSYACHMMVVESRDSPDVKIVAQVLPMIAVLLSERKKAIFIVNQGPAGLVFQKVVKEKKLVCKVNVIVDYECSYNALSTRSQNKILHQEILFQGHGVPLSEVLNEDDQMHIDAIMLNDLISKHTVKFGGELPNLGDVKNYYRKRSFESMEEISKNIFTGDRIEDVLFISGSAEVFNATNNTIHQPAKNSFLSEDDQFMELCKVYPDSNIHWLKFENEKLFWVRTIGSVNKLQKFRRFYTTHKFSEDVVSQQNGSTNVIIICDTAGMGKSTVLTVIAQKIKSNFPNIWVVRINLNDYLYQLAKLAKELIIIDSDEERHDFLVEFFVSELLTFQTEIEKRVFESSLREGRVAMLCDGFDEISPDYKDVVIYLLLELKKFRLKKIIVTTRPYMRGILEEKLGVFSWTLKPLSYEEQKYFLSEYWKNARKMSDDDIKEKLFDEYAERLIISLTSLVNDQLMSFTGIPLQMKMVADVFPKDCEDLSAGNDEVNIPSKLDLLSLYKLFIRKKYDVYKSEKTKHFTVAAEILVESNFGKFVQTHQELSLLYLLKEDQYKILMSEKQLVEVRNFVSKIELGEEKTGIINEVYSVGEVKVPNFVHRSFAEYFAAEFIAAKLGEVHDETVQLFILQNFLISEDHIGLRAFFNSRISVAHLLDGVLRAYGETMRKLWLKDWKCVCNKNQRTAIFEAVTEGNGEILNFCFAILEKHSDILESLINVVDDNDMSALHCSVSVGNSKAIEMLLDKGADYNVKEGTGHKVLHKACHEGHPKLVKIILCKIALANVGDEGVAISFRSYIENVTQIRFNYMIGDDVDMASMTESSRAIFEETARSGVAVAVQLAVDVTTDEGLYELLELVSILLSRRAARITGNGNVEAACSEATGMEQAAHSVDGACAVSRAADLYLELMSDRRDVGRVRAPREDMDMLSQFYNLGLTLGATSEILDPVCTIFKTYMQLNSNPNEVHLIEFLLQRGAYIITKSK